jgi:hypothetical protein
MIRIGAAKFNTCAQVLSRFKYIVFLLPLLVALPIEVSVICSSTPSARALSTIRNIDLSLTAMTADARLPRLTEIFDHDAFIHARDALMRRDDLTIFDASVQLHTTALYALLREGRKVLIKPESAHLREILRTDVLQGLADSYVQLGNDPWDSPYQFFVGPWPEEWGPIAFRRPGPFANEPLEADEYTVTLYTENMEPYQVGRPAKRSNGIYIWTRGKNRVSDQAQFNRTDNNSYPARSHFRFETPDRYLGGGDDINSWDGDKGWKDHYPRKGPRFPYQIYAVYGVALLIALALIRHGMNQVAKTE